MSIERLRISHPGSFRSVMQIVLKIFWCDGSRWNKSASGRRDVPLGLSQSSQSAVAGSLCRRPNYSWFCTVFCLSASAQSFAETNP